jgi:nitroreductase
MDILEIIKKNRSYRKFIQNEPVSHRELESMIEAARLSASAANRQPLKYLLCNNEASSLGKEIFECLAWAGYIKEWDGPAEGEKPAAYIILLHDKSVHPNIYCDAGIAMQSILLQAVSLGYGGCIFASVNRPRLAKFLTLPDRFEILYVVALGKPAETVVLEKTNPDLTAGENIKYWRDANGIHHVPKRSLNELIIDL